MRTDPPSLHADEPAEQATRLVARYGLPALPVVNGDEAMVGIVTQDDAMDVA